MQSEDPTPVPKKLRNRGETQTTQLRPEEPLMSPSAYSLSLPSTESGFLIPSVGKWEEVMEGPVEEKASS